MGKRRFELVAGRSSKFWEVSVSGSSVIVGFGRIGTAGQRREKSFRSGALAKAHADKLVAEKTAKGYVARDARSGMPQKAPSSRKASAGKTASRASGAFVDPNFKLAVIQALWNLGELEELETRLEKDRSAGKLDSYFENADGDAYFGAHPRALEYVLSQKLSPSLLSKVTRIAPDGGDAIYGLLAPHWDGEDDLFSCTGLEDVALLPNLQELKLFHAKPLKDGSPLLRCKKLKGLSTDGGRFLDKATLKALEARGVRIYTGELPPTADRQRVETKTPAQRAKRKPSADRSKPPRFSNENFKLAVMDRLFRMGHFRELFAELMAAPDTKAYKQYFKRAKGAAYRGAYPPLLQKVLATKVTWEQLDQVKLLLPGKYSSTYLFLGPETDMEKDYPFYIDDLQDVVLLENLEELCGFSFRSYSDCSALLACKKLKVLRDYVGYFADDRTLEQLKARGVKVSKKRPPDTGWSD